MFKKSNEVFLFQLVFNNLWILKNKIYQSCIKNKLNYLPIVIDSISLSETISSDVLTETMSFMRVLDPFSALPIR